LQTYLDQADELLPELPNETKTRLTRQYDITLADVEVLLSMDDVEGAGVTYFEEVVNGPAGAEEAQSSIDPDPKRAVNWIVNELLGRLTRQGQVWTTDRLPAHILRSLLNMVDAGEMTGTSAKNLLKHLLDQPFVPPGLDIKSLGTEMGLITSSEDSSDSLKALCEQVIEKLPAEAESVRKGREKVVMRLVGQVMKDSKGTADAQKARTMLLAMLSSQ
jgi:aspartyl-tRNA(Asn)/glutamyl-tRNA(Gln) amidotransferase subunit B